MPGDEPIDDVLMPDLPQMPEDMPATEGTGPTTTMAASAAAAPPAAAPPAPDTSDVVTDASELPELSPKGKFFAANDSTGEWAVFGSWAVCKQFLELRLSDDANGSCRYRPFDDMMSAVMFAAQGKVPMSDVIPPGAATSVAIAVSSSAAAAKQRGKKTSGRKRKKGSADDSAAKSAGVEAAAFTAAAVAAGQLKKRKPHKSWERNFERIAALRARKGTFAVEETDPEVASLEQELLEKAAKKKAIKASDPNAAPEADEGEQPAEDRRSAAEKLRRWIADQRQEFKLYSQGKNSTMTVEKLVKLGEIGFEFGKSSSTAAAAAAATSAAAIIAAEDRKAAAEEEDEDSGTAGAGKSNLTSTGKEKHNRKKKRTLTPAKQRAAEEEWERFFQELLVFKEQEGHCNVPGSRKDPLSKWVGKQRYEYKLLRQPNSISRMTTAQLMRLQDAGFQFAPRSGSYCSWDERLQQLRAFKERHGHCRVPVNDEVLGPFVRAQRDAYRKKQEGLTTNMSDQRLEQLQEIGFVLEAGKRRGPTVGPTKSWEERFQDLMQYRAEHGNCLVPQNYPGLGYWVHAQRNQYRLLKEGKKSQMTHEKALKLADSGFVFDAKKGKRRMTGGLPDLSETQLPSVGHAHPHAIDSPHRAVVGVAPTLQGYYESEDEHGQTNV